MGWGKIEKYDPPDEDSIMLKAVLRNGVIQPLEPLPSDWNEGQELQVESSSIPVKHSPEFIREWAAEMQRLCADSTDEDEQRLTTALDEFRREGKEEMMREVKVSE